MASAVQALGIDGFNLMGTSFGGKVALWLAAQQAVDLTKDNPDSAAGKAARQEQDRLMKYAQTGTPSTPPKN